ncbi:hypothetical protein CC2G_003591 [Coprinopsis cinerea AmutBmut pab1-1]|nr:hypothetical protein CC2G_003591 [Coprinopsis cinerea AmutBmut pab1-1]
MDDSSPIASPSTTLSPPAAPEKPLPFGIEATAYAFSVISDNGLWCSWTEALDQRGAIVRCSNTECQLEGCTLLGDVLSCLKCFENDAIGPGRCDLPLLYLRRFMETKDILPEEKVRPFVTWFAKRYLGYQSPFSDLSGLKDARRQLADIRRSAPPTFKNQLSELQRTLENARKDNLKATAAVLRSCARWRALSRIIKTAMQQLDPEGHAAVDLDLELELEMDLEGLGDGSDLSPAISPNLIPALSTLRRCHKLDLLS